jgi:hypothetical protein
MKQILLAVIITAAIFPAMAQGTLVLQPGPCDGKDAQLTSQPALADVNWGTNEVYDAVAWTCQGSPCYAKSLLQFNLSYLPQGAVITSAYLSLYANLNAGDGYAGTPMWGNNNAGYLKRVTDYWKEDSVTWNTQPTSVTTGQVLLPQSTSTTQDYLNIDITGFVQYWNQNPGSNYGMMLEMITTNHYNSLIFCSSDCADSTKRPKLVITYTTPTGGCVSIQPDACGGKDAQLTSQPALANVNWGTNEVYDAVAWTCQGSPCYAKSLLQFDLSYIPQGAAISSASLSLYANLNAGDGYTGTPMWGSNNAGYLKRITSSWSEDQVTWNTQPTSVTTGQVLLPQSTSTTQDYLNIDVTGFVQYWNQNPGSNYGMVLEMITTNNYNSLIFCSSDCPEATKRPKLDICFSVPTAVNEISAEQSFKLFPNPASGSFQINCNGLQAEWVCIYSTDGKLLQKIYQPAGNHIEINNLTTGIYIAEIKVKDVIQRVKWMKM